MATPDTQLTSANLLWDPGPSFGGHFAIPALEFLWGSYSPLCCSGISGRTWLLQGQLYCLFPSPSQDVGEPGRGGAGTWGSRATTAKSGSWGFAEQDARV